MINNNYICCFLSTPDSWAGRYWNVSPVRDADYETPGTGVTHPRSIDGEDTGPRPCDRRSSGLLPELTEGGTKPKCWKERLMEGFLRKWRLSWAQERTVGTAQVRWRRKFLEAVLWVLEWNAMNERSQARKAKVFAGEHVDIVGAQKVFRCPPECYLLRGTFPTPMPLTVRTSVSAICDVWISVYLGSCSISLPLDCETYDGRDQDVLEAHAHLPQHL